MPNTPSTPKPEPKETPKEAPKEAVEPISTPQPVSNIPANERMLAAAAYFPLLFIGALIMKPESKFCQMHAKQGMILSVIAFVILFVLAAIPMIGSLLFLGLIGAIAIGGFQAYSGVEWKMPVLHGLAMKINVDKLFAGTTVKPTSTKPEEAKAPETPATTAAPVAPAAPTPPPAVEPKK